MDTIKINDKITLEIGRISAGDDILYTSTYLAIQCDNLNDFFKQSGRLNELFKNTMYVDDKGVKTSLDIFYPQLDMDEAEVIFYEVIKYRTDKMNKNKEIFAQDFDELNYYKKIVFSTVTRFPAEITALSILKEKALEPDEIIQAYHVFDQLYTRRIEAHNQEVAKMNEEIVNSKKKTGIRKGK